MRQNTIRWPHCCRYLHIRIYRIPSTSHQPDTGQYHIFSAANNRYENTWLQRIVSARMKLNAEQRECSYRLSALPPHHTMSPLIICHLRHRPSATSPRRYHSVSLRAHISFYLLLQRRRCRHSHFIVIIIPLRTSLSRHSIIYGHTECHAHTPHILPPCRLATLSREDARAT